MRSTRHPAPDLGRLVTDERGVSTTVGYVLSLGVATLLLTGLLLAAGNFMADQREGASRTELRVVGQQLASDLAGADRLAQAADDGSVTVRRSLPPRVVGSAYTIRIDQGGAVTDGYVITLEAENGVTATARFTAETDVATPTSLTGGDVVISYDTDGSAVLEVTNA